MRDDLLIARKDMLCLGVGNSPFEAIYVELHNLVGVQNGSYQVHLRKAHSYWENSSVADFVVRIRYRLHHSEGNALADYLAQQPINDYQPMHPKFPDEDIMALFEEEVEDEDKDKWVVWFDGVSNALGHGIGAVLVSSDK